MSELERYASPGLRWGLITEDWPGVTATFGIATAAELEIPSRVAAPDEEFVTAVIIFPPESGRAAVTGYKPWSLKVRGKDGRVRDVNVEHASDHYQVLCTKALGRALKRCGYPDDLDDLKSLLVWRQKLAELAALGSGAARLEMASADVAGAIEAAAKPADATEYDDGDAPSSDPDRDVSPEVAEARVVDAATSSPSRETVSEMRKHVNALDEDARKALRDWCRAEGVKMSDPATEEHAQRIAVKAIELLARTRLDEREGAAPDDAPAPAAAEPEGEGGGDAPPATDRLAGRLREEIATLNDTERQAFSAYLAELGVAPEQVESGDVDDDQLERIVSWLEIG